MHDERERDENDNTEQTIPARPVTRVAGIALLLLLVFGLVASALNPNLFERHDGADLVTGEWTSRYQADYEGGLLIQEPSTHLWSLARWVLFGEGRPGVVVGSDGWLFTREEFLYYEDEARQVEHCLDYSSTVRDTLAESGIELVVALVPAKARIHEERLGRRPLPSYTRDRYANFRAALVERGIAAPDLAAALAAVGPGEEAFLRTDTHWTPAGASAAAEALAADIASVLERTSASRISYVRRRGETVVHEGDLLSFIPLGPFQERFGPEPDRVASVTTQATSEPDVGLFGEIEIPVTLVGTSYSAGELWDFAGAIQRSVEADVLNVAVSGEGPFVPMRDYLESETIRDTPPRVVVWEIPERYLPVSYPVGE
ncbi:MAG: alginate O-acetyltransferase AlgX-related protein [Spirochaetota bacterium]